jgi:uncharacterized protein YkwD
MKRLLYIQLGLALTALVALSGLSLAAEPAPYRPHPWQDRAMWILIGVNHERQKAGLPALQFDYRIWSAAYAHANNMAQQNQLNHVLDGKGPADRISAAGYNWSYYGENIAYNYASAQATVTGWMNSPPHRANILNPNFVHGSVASAFNAQGQWYDCMDFARPR